MTTKNNIINILPSLLPSYEFDVLVKQPIYKGFDNEILASIPSAPAAFVFFNEILL